MPLLRRIMSAAWGWFKQEVDFAPDVLFLDEIVYLLNGADPALGARIWFNYLSI